MEARRIYRIALDKAKKVTVTTTTIIITKKSLVLSVYNGTMKL